MSIDWDKVDLSRTTEELRRETGATASNIRRHRRQRGIVGRQVTFPAVSAGEVLPKVLHLLQEAGVEGDDFWPQLDVTRTWPYPSIRRGSRIPVFERDCRRMAKVSIEGIIRLLDETPVEQEKYAWLRQLVVGHGG